MYNIQLNWKQHNVDLSAFEAHVKSLDSNCCGSSADSKLTLHFSEEPSQETKDAIEQKWLDLDDDTHAMCVSYQSQADKQSAKQAAKAAAITALATASGLTQEQIQALLG